MWSRIQSQHWDGDHKDMDFLVVGIHLYKHGNLCNLYLVVMGIQVQGITHHQAEIKTFQLITNVKTSIREI